MKKFYLLLFLLFSILKISFGQCNKYSLGFNGSSSYVSIPNNNGLRPDYLTISLNFKTTSTSLQALLHNLNSSDGSSLNYGISMNHTGFSPIATYAATTTHGSNCTPGNGFSTCKSQTGFVPMNVWINVAFTYDGTVQKLYINGNQIQSNTINKGAIDKCLGGQLLLGIYTLSSPLYLSGKMDEVMIYNRALSQAEVQQRMNSILTPANETGLIAYYRFEEGVGNEVFDLSGNGNHGTTYNCTWSTDVPFSSTMVTNLNTNGNHFLCDNDSLLLQAPLKSNFKYAWYLNGTAIGNATSRSYYAKATGNYYCIVMDTAGGCQKNSDTATLTLYALPPVPQITGLTNLPSGTLTSVYTSTNTVGLTHLWTAINGTITSGQGTNSVSVTWNASGLCALNLSVTYINNCSNSKTLTITRGVGIHPGQNNFDVAVFPNPFHDKITVTIDGGENNLLEIFNMIGKQVYITQANNEAEINLAQFSAGTYYLKVSNADGVVTKKMVKF